MRFTAPRSAQPSLRPADQKAASSRRPTLSISYLFGLPKLPDPAKVVHMNEHLTWRQRLSNRIYAIPAVTQWWAKRAAVRAHAASTPGAKPPFTPLHKPLAAARGALITTAGVHLRGQHPFDMDNPDGDATYRQLPATATADMLTITHKYYDHTDADRDINVVFPLAHFRDLAERGVIGSLAPRHYGFMGHIEGEQTALLTHRYAAEVAAKLRQDGVDFAFLTPA